MVDLDSMDNYKALFDTWKENLCDLLHMLQSKGKEPILVAMSRKMPRLIEWMKRNNSNGEFDNCRFVSEHVLPFVLGGLDVDRQCIVIVDDAIYYGSTIKHIIGYIRTIQSEAKVYICPVAISEVVGEIPNADVKRLEENTIREQDIPFYTTRNAVRIISLSRPIDVEFPILHFTFHATSDWRNNMKSVLEKHFQDCDVYDIVHLIGEEKDYTYSYNVLPRKNTQYDCWNKDFSKLRFFVSDNAVQVAAYAPGILPETAINDSHPLFSDVELQSIWADVQNHETASWPDSSNGVFIIDPTRDAYNKQRIRSKIMWANYLASFLYMLVRKKAIQASIAEIFGLESLRSATFSEEDTCLLLPPKKVGYITSALGRRFNSDCEENSVFNGLHSSVLANQELIPPEYKDGYIKSIQRGIQRCGTAGAALSLLFSSQHFFINKGGLAVDALQRTQRLRFGITYTALENKLAFPVGINGLWKSIHNWIDKNIDEGTVKPKYERVVIDGDAYWLRMFRAGENEDAFTKLRRLCEFVIAGLRKKEYRSYVKRNHVENLLTLAWVDPCAIVNHDYRWASFDIERDANDPVCAIVYQLPSGRYKRFVDYLTDQGYLSSICESSGVTRLSAIDESRVATPLTALQEQAITDYIDTYWYYAETRFQAHIMNNFIPLTGEQAFFEKHSKLVDWCRRFEGLMNTKVSSEYNIDAQQEEFNQIDDEFNHLIRVTVKVLDYVAGKLENENREKIENHLWKGDTVEYTQFKKELMAAAVVKELFEQMFLKPKKKKSADSLEDYLDLIEEKGGTSDTIRAFIYMNERERQMESSRSEFVLALQDVIKRHIG